jgi:hypothetical protein
MQWLALFSQTFRLIQYYLLCIYLGGASGSLCNFDDFIGIDQGSLEGTGQGEDRFCGAKLLDHDFIICLYFSRYLSDFLMKFF